MGASFPNLKRKRKKKKRELSSELTEKVSEIEGLGSGPGGVIGGGSVFGGIIEPPVGAAHCVVGVSGGRRRV